MMNGNCNDCCMPRLLLIIPDDALAKCAIPEMEKLRKSSDTVLYREHLLSANIFTRALRLQNTPTVPILIDRKGSEGHLASRQCFQTTTRWSPEALRKNCAPLGAYRWKPSLCLYTRRSRCIHSINTCGRANDKSIARGKDSLSQICNTRKSSTHPHTRALYYSRPREPDRPALQSYDDTPTAPLRITKHDGHGS